MLKTNRSSEQKGGIQDSKSENLAPVLAISFPNQVTL